MQAQRLLIATAIFTLGACTLWEPKVVCSDGTRCPDGTTCAENQDICITGPCGNGVMDEGELCDDGNVKSGDGCRRDCLSQEICGDGVEEEGLLEVCDDGNLKSGDGCSSDCRSREDCGNGILDPQAGELCDDGNKSDLDGCRSDCMSLEICGDGVKDERISEVCDDGNVVSGDACSSDCRSNEQCGNGVLDRQVGEVCDDGNTSEDDSCSSDCMNGCGDGVIREAEQCELLPWSNPSQMSCTQYREFHMGRLDCDSKCEHTYDTCVSFDLDFIQPTLASDAPGLNSIWSDSDGSGYAVGNQGTIIKFEHTHWAMDGVPGGFSNTNLHGVWGSEGGQVYAVGDAGAILTRGPTEWVAMTDPGSSPDAAPRPSLKGVWGYTHNNTTTVFAVGDDCTILRLDGGSWVSESGPSGCSDTRLQAVSGNGRGRIYAVGSSSTLLRRGNDTWTRPQLNGVEMPSLDDIWVGADDAIFLAAGDHIYKCEDDHKDGDPEAGSLQCDEMRYPGNEVHSIWGASPHDVFAVSGDTIYHSNGFLGDKWVPQFVAGQEFGDIHGSSAFDIFVTSDRGVQYGILPWRKMNSVFGNLLSVWADETATYVAGMTGVFKLDEHDAWQEVLSGRGAINALWGAGPSQVFAVGYEYDSNEQRTVGLLFLFTVDHQGEPVTVEEWEVPRGNSPYLRSVWASDTSNVFIVGDDGVALHYDNENGQGWEVVTGADAGVALYDVWGDMQDVFAVGSSGTILRYEDGRWAPEDVPLSYDGTTLFAVWGISADNIFAVGQYGTILHYDGGGWEAMDSPTLATLYDIGGIVIEDDQIKLFAVGDDGLVLYYDGDAWSEVRTGTMANFDGVWVTPMDAFMVANDGNAYRLRHGRIEIPSLE